MQSTPAIPRAHRELMRGYAMPSEWALHAATYLVWPHNLETWPGKFESIPRIFAMMAAAIAESEPVRILVNDADQIDSVRVILQTANARLDRIELLAIATNDSWIRDTGPMFVNRGSAQIAIGWKFNSWGEKYGQHDLDDAIVRRLGERYGFDVVEPGIVLEGGSVDVNGVGTLITTEACLLNKNRNPHLSRVEIDDFLCTYLGASNVLWLGDGIAGDDTDGHVDDLARFVEPDTIVTMVEDDPGDANHAPLRDNLARLHAMRDQDGRPFRIETLPMPPALFCEGTRLPASYANFYITNGAVIVPTFGCAQDQIAMATLARLFAGRGVVGIPSVDLVLGLGTIHCLTQQHPVA